MAWLIGIVLGILLSPGIFGGEDVGWAGAWEPNVVGEGTLNELKNRAGEPVITRNGRPYEWVRVNLRTGEVIYPDRGGSRNG